LADLPVGSWPANHASFIHWVRDNIPLFTQYRDSNTFFPTFHLSATSDLSLPLGKYLLLKDGFVILNRDGRSSSRVGNSFDAHHVFSATHHGLAFELI
jgi:hypothetical protein